MAIYRRKRMMRRRPRRKYIPRRKNAVARKVNLKKQLHYFDRWCSASNENARLVFTGSDATPNLYGAITFALSDLPAYSDFTNLFDQYRIVKIQYRFCLERDPGSNTGSANPGLFPRITWIHDFNSSEVPANEAELLECGRKCRSMSLTDQRPISKWFTLKPAIQTQIFSNGTTYTLAPKWGTMLDTDDYAVNHFGLRYALLYLVTGMSVRMQCRYTIACSKQN